MTNNGSVALALCLATVRKSACCIFPTSLQRIYVRKAASSSKVIHRLHHDVESTVYLTNVVDIFLILPKIRLEEVANAGRFHDSHAGFV